MDEVEFTWFDDSFKQTIVVKPQDAIAVYLNPDGLIVIRQQDPMGDRDDVIAIHKQHVAVLIQALQKLSTWEFPEPTKPGKTT
jgi:hypothetical protein